MDSKSYRRSHFVGLLIIALLSILFWAIVFVVGVKLLTRAAGAQEVVTCEGLIAEIDGVYWEWPNAWSGAWVCYPGVRDEGVALVTVTREVTIKGSPTALRKMGLIDE